MVGWCGLAATLTSIELWIDRCCIDTQPQHQLYRIAHCANFLYIPGDRLPRDLAEKLVDRIVYTILLFDLFISQWIPPQPVRSDLLVSYAGFCASCSQSSHRSS